MTDTDAQNAPKDTLPLNSDKNNQRTLTQNINLKDLAAKPITSENNKKPIKAPEPQLKKIEIVIAGISYPIFCPVTEEEELRAAVYDINNAMLDLKKEAPNLTQENLLVLCCLNLHEKISDNNKSDINRSNESRQTESLLSKIMNDAQSIL